MRFLLLNLFVAFFYLGAQGAELTVFDVRKNLPLKDDDKVLKDYFLNGGIEYGLKNGSVVVVTRRVNLYDSYQNKSPGEMTVAIAKLKIIQSQKGVSVARLVSVFSRENLPTLEYESIMVGDRVDTNYATANAGLIEEKKDESKNEMPTPEKKAEAVKVESVPAPTPQPAPTQNTESKDFASTAPPKVETPNPVAAPTLQ